MENIVEIIKHEYHSESVLRTLNFAYRWAAVMCATGPTLLTASAREYILGEALSTHTHTHTHTLTYFGHTHTNKHTHTH